MSFNIKKLLVFFCCFVFTHTKNVVILLFKKSRSVEFISDLSIQTEAHERYKNLLCAMY